MGEIKPENTEGKVMTENSETERTDCVNTEDIRIEEKDTQSAETKDSLPESGYTEAKEEEKACMESGTTEETPAGETYTESETTEEVLTGEAHTESEESQVSQSGDQQSDADVSSPGADEGRKIWDDDVQDEAAAREEERAYEERRAARRARILKRQKRRRRRMAAVGTLTAAAALFFCAYLYYGETMTSKFQEIGGQVLTKLETLKKEETKEKETQETSVGSDTVKKNTEEKGGEKQAEPTVEPTAEPTPPQTELTEAEKKVYRRAKRYAQQYNYDKAIKTLKSSDTYSSNDFLQLAAKKYKKKKDSCVAWPLEEVTHVFYHSLIVDPSRAFDDYKSGDYNQFMTTVDEFNKITQSMYDKGYVLVNVYDMASCDENGNITRGEILLPPGKIPFVLSQDDVCYYHYMDGDGFASKLVVDEDGKVRNEYVEADGSVSIGDYDVAPLLDRFVEEHPDFSYRGAKGILALTGYNGILGYRTDSSYDTVPDDIDDNKLQWLKAHPDFDFEKEKEEAKKVAQALKDGGWLFASHTWGHKNVQDVSMERLRTDTEKFKANVDPLIGGTDIIIFAFGADLAQTGDYSGEKFEYLKSQGYNYYCNVDSQKYFVQIRDNYFRMGRRNLDGYRMYYNPDVLEDLFDASAVFDSSRPVPVPEMAKN